MRTLRYTLVADGSSDAALKPIIEWLVTQHCPNTGVLGEFSCSPCDGSRALNARIPRALKLFPCDLLIVHRDAEAETPASRLEEIRLALLGFEGPWIPAIPVRMTEAWLFSDELAIRAAAENRNGRVKLNLPSKKSWESLPDPKQALFDALILASEKSARALRKFSPDRQRAQVAYRTRDFSQLRGVPSFDQFELAFSSFLREFHALD